MVPKSLIAKFWRVIRPVVANSHHFDEEPDPDRRQRERSDQQLGEKSDQDPHHSEKPGLDPVPHPIRIRNTAVTHVEK